MRMVEGDHVPGAFSGEVPVSVACFRMAQEVDDGEVDDLALRGKGLSRRTKRAMNTVVSPARDVRTRRTEPARRVRAAREELLDNFVTSVE